MDINLNSLFLFFHRKAIKIMFSSAWRKFTKKQDEKHVFPMGVAPVDQTMQKKYAKGVQYNSKNKTCLVYLVTTA